MTPDMMQQYADELTKLRREKFVWQIGAVSCLLGCIMLLFR